MPTVRRHGGTNIDPAALHLASQQGVHLLTEIPKLSKFCHRVLAFLPDWHVARQLQINGF